MNGVSVSRGQILTIGPMLLVATCYGIAAPSRHPVNQIVADTISADITTEENPSEPLPHSCQTLSSQLRLRLPASWTTIVREPLVIGGDLIESDLEQLHEQTIVPTMQALKSSYFERSPRHPIAILICSSDAQFRECNLRLDDRERERYSGIYSRKDRRVVVNISSGEGTLAHELTHALAHADFPAMPEWFDEGLASLHEECEFSLDGTQLIGNENWRREVAFEALQRGELRMIEDVTSKRFGSADRANIDYAHVRSLCLYLQESGFLESFYRTCRANSATDPTGLHSLCRATNSATPRSLDDAFQAWLIARSSHRN